MEIAGTAISLGAPVVAVLDDGELAIKLSKAASFGRSFASTQRISSESPAHISVPFLMFLTANTPTPSIGEGAVAGRTRRTLPPPAGPANEPRTGPSLPSPG